MKASDARQIAIDSVNEQILDAQRQIKKAAETGAMSISLQNLKPATKEWLIENGFKIDHSDTANYGFDTVSW